MAHNLGRHWRQLERLRWADEEAIKLRKQENGKGPLRSLHVAWLCSVACTFSQPYLSRIQHATIMIAK
jgi:hypothetical protein